MKAEARQIRKIQTGPKACGHTLGVPPGTCNSRGACYQLNRMGVTCPQAKTLCTASLPLAFCVGEANCPPLLVFPTL